MQIVFYGFSIVQCPKEKACINLEDELKDKKKARLAETNFGILAFRRHGPWYNKVWYIFISIIHLERIIDSIENNVQNNCSKATCVIWEIMKMKKACQYETMG